MLGMFKKKYGDAAHTGERLPRHSRGWIEVRTYLREAESLRILDFGSTSPANINFLTMLGHSVYMANVVQDTTRPEWWTTADGTSGDGKKEFDVERFVEENLDFSGRDFDVILLWDTANYLPPSLVPALFTRLRSVLRPHGRLLAFFHGRLTGPETAFSRFQLNDGDELIILDAGTFPVQQVYQTRQVEKLLEGFGSVRFFLGKDNVREVIAIR